MRRQIGSTYPMVPVMGAPESSPDVAEVDGDAVPLPAGVLPVPPGSEPPPSSSREVDEEPLSACGGSSDWSGATV